MSTCVVDDQEVRYQIAQVKELPPLPQSVHRLMEIIQDDVESSEELESIIGYDEAVTSKVMQVANSSYYGFRRMVKTISRAIVVIGFNQAKSICLITLLKNFFSEGRQIDPILRERLWTHSLTTSRVAVEISKRRPWVHREEAGVLGLIHDIGRLAMAAFFSDQFKIIMDAASRRKVPPWCVEAQLGLTHTEVGKCLASRWALPESMRAVIEFHHAPGLSDSHKSETRLVHLANVISNSIYYPYLLEDEATLSYCRDLYISEEEWREYRNSLDFIRPEVDQLWLMLK